MNTVQPRALLAKLYRYFWSLIVVLLILSAVALTVVRTLLPYADAYRGEVEQVLTQTLGQKVRVRDMTAELVGLHPALVLKGVTVYGAAGKQVLFKFETLSVGFSVSRSILDKRPIPVSLNITGTRLKILREASGQVRINNLPLRMQVAGGGAQMPQLQPVLKWMLQHGRLSVNDVDLGFQNEADGLKLHFEHVQMKLKNSGSRHQIEGIAQLPEAWGSQAGFSVDLQAEDFKTPSQWKLSSYVLAQGLNLPEITKTFPISGSRIDRGIGNFQLWSSWEGSRLQSFEALASTTDLSMRVGKQSAQPLELESVNTHIIAKHLKDKLWELSVPRLQLTDQGVPQESMTARLQWDTGSGEVDARANVIDLRDVSRLLLASGQLTPQWSRELAEVAPEGKLRDLHLMYHSEHQRPEYKLAMRLDGVSSRAWGRLPGIRNVSGLVWLDQDSGAAQLDSRDVTVAFAKRFRKPWSFKHLDGLLQWRKLGETWHVSTDRLMVDGDDGDMALRMRLMLPRNRPGYLDLMARLDKLNLSRLPRYYPVQIMSPSLVDWLDRAIVSGQARRGTVIYHGSLKAHEFPFRQGQGKFEVAFDAEDVHLDYLKDWPALTQMHGHLVFDGPGMHIRAQSGTMNHMKVSAFSADVDDFRQPWLRLKGQVDGGTGDAVSFIANSPLREHAGSVVDRLQATGDSHLDLSMNIPLNSKLGSTRYTGKLHFTDSTLTARLGQGRLQANQLAGRLDFSERGYHARDITATIFGHPARVHVSTRNQGEERMVEILIRGHASSEALNEELKLGIFRYLKGESDVTARLQLLSGKQSRSLLLVDSMLQGMAIDLPAPLGKPADQAESLQAHWDLDTDELGLSLDNEFHAALLMEKGGDETALKRGDLHFGAGAAQLPGEDVFKLTGRLPNLPIKAWLRKLNGGGDGQDFIKGMPIQVRLSYLQLAKEAEQTPGSKPPKAHKPELSNSRNIDIDIQRLDYHDINLGRFTLLASPIETGYRIDVLALDGPILTMSSKGYWHQIGDVKTALNFQFRAPSTERVLSTFGFNTPIRGGSLRLNGNLQWPGAPDDFQLASIKGGASFHISDGRLDNIDPGAGRVFGLLSFQALPRRLALDFRDLFGKGYRFDTIKGDLQIHDGSAHTSNMVISSPSSRINISGRTGLVDHSYDQSVVIVPGDGSNLFGLGALAGGLQAGVVVWLVEKLFDVDKYSRFIYKITGTWDHPIITNLSDTAAAKGKP